METEINRPRLARLLRECEASAVPAVLLLAACAVLVLVLATQALLAAASQAPADAAPSQSLPAAA